VEINERNLAGIAELTVDINKNESDVIKMKRKM
jgi:hypothetical protein